jgi:hypothetical protein
MNLSKVETQEQATLGAGLIQVRHSPHPAAGIVTETHLYSRRCKNPKAPRSRPPSSTPPARRPPLQGGIALEVIQG